MSAFMAFHRSAEHISSRSFRRRAGLHLTGLWVAVALVISGTSCPAAEAKAGTGRVVEVVDAKWLDSELKQLRASPDANASLKVTLIEGYQRAQELLQERANVLADVKKQQAEIDAIPANVEQLRASLAAAQQQSATPPSPLTLPKIEDKVRQLDVTITAARGRLNEMAAGRQDRVGRQIEIARQMADAKTEIQNLSTAPDVSPAGEAPELAKLRGILKAGRLGVLDAKLQLLAARLLYSQSSGDLEALQFTEAGTRVVRLSEELEGLRSLLDRQRAAAVQKAVAQSEEKLKAVSGMRNAGVGLRELAERNVELLRMQTGIDSLGGRLAGAEQRLAQARNDLSTLQSDFERMKKRVAAIEATGGRADEALAQLLRERLGGEAPLSTLVRSQSRSLNKEISAAMIQLDNLQDERTTLGDPDSPPVGIVRKSVARSPQERAIELELLQNQREYLDVAIADCSSYLQALTELQVAQSSMVGISEKFSLFINEHVLWIRSAPRWAFRNPGRRWEIFLRYWPADGIAEISRVLTEDVADHWVPHFVFVGLFVLLLFFGGRLRARSRKLAEKAARRMCTNFMVTLEEGAYTLVLAVRWPLLLFFAGWRLGLADSAVEETFVRCVGASLVNAARALFLYQLLRGVCRPEFGLGEAHFQWQPHNMRLAWRHLAWFVPLIIPLVFMVNVIERQGFEASSGQFIFMVDMLILSGFAHFMLRPEGGIEITNADGRVIPRHKPLRMGLYLAGIGVPLFLAGAAYLGYYFSALELIKRVLNSLWACWFLSLACSLILRWFMIRQHRIAIHEAEVRRAARENDAGENAPRDESSALDLDEIDQQTSRLVGTLFWIALVLTVFAIWSETFPALKVLDSVKLWPVALSAPAAQAASAAKPLIPFDLLSGNSASIAPQLVSGANEVTLLDLLYAVITLLVTFTASRNLPGLLKVTFLSRLKLERGVDHAAVTLVRYGIMLAGLITVSNLLGLDWSKIQWIAAAFSLGIAFGLQELFANFVSGLIILFERPIRLGDIISVGEVTGTVTRINIRATTITDSDRRDFLIPNKNFITGNVLNWTLSDPVSRVTVPVGVAYGSDTELAEKLMIEAALENPYVMKDPEPKAVLSEFGDNTLNFHLYIFLPDRQNYLTMLHQLTSTIDRKFRVAGINLAFPQRDVHLFAEKPIDVRVVPAENEPPKR